jgi:DNA-binding protein H-NS
VEINLNAMNLKDLKDLQSQVTRAIATYEDRRKKEARARLEETARELGYTFAELAETAAPRSKSTSAAKYANPANRADTWTGRGRKPRWFSEALAAGRNPADMAI